MLPLVFTEKHIEKANIYDNFFVYTNFFSKEDTITITSQFPK